MALYRLGQGAPVRATSTFVEMSDESVTEIIMSGGACPVSS